MKHETMTFDEAYSYQAKDLAYWRNILKPEVYAELEKWVKAKNKMKYRSPYDVCRGSHFHDFILNWKGKCQHEENKN